jgi:hypothetical protein
MLKRILSTLSTGALLVVAMPVLAHAQQMASAPKGTQKTVTGTVIDVSCKFGQGLSVSASMPGEGSNQQLKPYAEQKVTVRGTVFAAGGANAIQIASIQ